MSSSTPDPDLVASRIVETIREPLLVLDEELRVVRANPSFCRTFRVSQDLVEGHRLDELGDGEWDVPALRSRLSRAMEEEEPFEGFEVVQSFPDVGRRVMRINGRSLPWKAGESRTILLAIEDVTERLELESDLRRHARELERSNADLEQFAYAASHDLQEPLRMVASYLELLERRYRDQLDEEACEFIDYAVDGARRMKALINGLLAYSRVGRKDGSMVEVDLDAVLDDVLDDLGGRIRDTGAEIECGPLPTTHGSPEQLRQVLQNLIENALVYCGEGTPRIEVRSEERDDGSVAVEVADQGPGIPPEAQDKVFQIFHQLDPHGEGREGAGMGLALCRKIVERHGGRIGVSSEPGEGATFRFTLDLDPEEAP